MTKTFVSSNCATPALARGIALLCPDLRVSQMEITAARAAPEDFVARIKAADRLVLLPEVRTMALNLAGAAALDGKTVVTVPGFYFSGYHPDIGYVRSAKGYPVNTRFGSYHSIICLAAYLHGLSPAQTLPLYNTETFTALDYFGEWDRQRQLLTTAFAEADLDIAQPFLRWSRQGCFMHTVNHPQSQCLFDLARLVAARLNTRVLDFTTPPPDTLAENAIFPCYPEIAENCGAAGHHLFKMTQRDTVVGLAEFIEMSFFTYRRHDLADLNLATEYARKAAAMARLLADLHPDAIPPRPITDPDPDPASDTTAATSAGAAR